DVLFVPSGDLAIFPLHACCWEKDGKLNYLIDDDLTVSYATSVSVFKRAWKLKRERADNFLFITNPDESLHYSDLEVDGIKQTFGVAKEDLRHGKATKETVKAEMQNGYSFYHFSCHGNYDRQDAFDSALKLADGEMTMKEIMETSLGNAWLTTLSACETGVVNFEETSDEHYGLPLGFVFAGCPSVWGTLWSVRDDATSELMKLAYQNIKDKIDKNIKGEIDKAEALRMAQIELKKNPKYNSPYYWAGFQHFGV
ncbi:MAG: CHAT domain-containing protein, partial [Acidobacteriota bacterium]|nr:CHAT domain-containing protein [Acidobacteriota bacterium]